jgi:L,D-peptidoglycan transpeptidase YkuD (ErfK/YbiS/YcfS/YnhG family)
MVKKTLKGANHNVSSQGKHCGMQLVIVLTPSWSSTQGKLYRYENQLSKWVPVGSPYPVIIGQAGMAWGIGLHGGSNEKREGDLKTPAGIFALGTTFGIGIVPPRHMDYLELTPSIEAVDDPKSRLYNQIVDRTKRIPDWNSSEKMASIDLYEMGLVIHHNYPKPIPTAGSAIFFHLWRNSNSSTAGCTAMCREHMRELLDWLDKEKQPRLVQLPHEAYQKFQTQWELPNDIIF